MTQVHMTRFLENVQLGAVSDIIVVLGVFVDVVSEKNISAD